MKATTMSSQLPKLIVILGPTATGKTKLAVALARKFKGEIISADSRQVYRGLDIGTGKDLAEYKLPPRSKDLEIFQTLPLIKGEKKRRSIPHHLIDIVKPMTEFNLAKFKKLALKEIHNIIKRGKLPILVGGTGLYISAIVNNYDIPKIKPAKKIRAKLEKLNKSNKLKMLKKLDPAALEFLDVKNPRRIDRALEVCLAGYKFSEIRKKAKPLFNVLPIGIRLPKNILNKRIDARVDKMIKNGLLEETKKLIKQYPPRWRVGGQYPAPLQTIGYAEIIDYINKKTTLNQAVNLIKLHTRQFAKRQMTWLKGMEKRGVKIHWLNRQKTIKKIIQRFLDN